MIESQQELVDWLDDITKELEKKQEWNLAKRVEVIKNLFEFEDNLEFEMEVKDAKVQRE